MRIFSSVVYRLPFIVWSFVKSQTNTPPGPKKRSHVNLFTYTVSDGYTNATGTVYVTVRSSGAQSQNMIGLPTDLPDGNKRITFAGIPGRTYHIQATTNLVSPYWEPIGTNVVGGNGLSTFDDLDATNFTSRYYRTTAP